MKKHMISFVLISLMFAFAACDKGDDNQQNTSPEDGGYELAERIFSGLKDISDDAYRQLNNNQKAATAAYLGDCATISFDNQDSLFVITIDFGDENCMCQDGKYRRGKIMNTYSGAYWQSGTVITHSFDDYYVNDHHVIGEKVVTNQGENDLGHPWYSMETHGAVITAQSGDTITWNSERTREWVEGDTTWERFDDVYLIDGISYGANRQGRDYTIEITESLRKEIGCPHIVSGVRVTNVEGKPERMLDYGDGTCDNQATLTINGNTYTITLP